MRFTVGFNHPATTVKKCPNKAAWDFDANAFDVLLGHPLHANVVKVVEGRTAVFGEFPEGAFETQTTDLRQSVSRYLTFRDLPYESYDDLFDSQDERVLEALTILKTDNRLKGDIEFVEKCGFHALAPAFIYALLNADENGGVSYPESDRIGYYDRETAGVWLLNPPKLRYTDGVLALDATPVRGQWEAALGTELRPEQVLSDEERVEFVRYTLNQRIAQISGHRPAARAYTNEKRKEERVNVRADYRLTQEIKSNHGRRPALATSKAAKDVYADSDLDITEVADIVDDLHFYGAKSSNELAEETLLLVTGSPHKGDRYIRKWCAFADEEYVDPGTGDDRLRGMKQSYGPFGNKILRQMREDEVFQLLMRAGRTGEETFIYVYTDALPEWLPKVATVEGFTGMSEGESQVRNALSTEWQSVASTAEEVSVGKRRIREILQELSDRGIVEKRKDPDDGRRIQWRKIRE